MFRKVMLATDLSPAYDDLIECIIDLKEIGTEELLLVWVVDIEFAGMSAPRYKEEHLVKLEEKVKDLKDMGITVSLEVPIGIPSHEICRLAEEKEVDLIVIGSRGERKIKQMFLGSTASNVIRISRKPVLLERLTSKGEGVEAVCHRKFRSLLLATDFSDEVVDAERTAMRLASKAEKVVIVSVAETFCEIDKKTPAVAKEVEKLETIEHSFNKVCQSVTVRLEEGIASENINRIASEEDVSLIIIGKKGRGGFKEMLLGSTADSVARRSNKPVLVVPKK